MALFDVFKKGKKKPEPPKKATEEIKKEKTGALSKASTFVSKDIIGLHVAEKSTFLNEKGIYVFEIGPKTNKVMVGQIIKEKYGVTPRKVNIINIPPKKISFRGKKGTKRGLKKAIVFLKKGDKIETA